MARGEQLRSEERSVGRSHDQDLVGVRHGLLRNGRRGVAIAGRPERTRSGLAAHLQILTHSRPTCSSRARLLPLLMPGTCRRSTRRGDAKDMLSILDKVSAVML